MVPPRSKHQRVAHLTSVHPYNDPRIFHKECSSLQRAGYEVFLVAPVGDAKIENGVHIVPVGRWRNRWHRIFVILPRVLVKALRVRAAIYHLHDPELLALAPILKASGAEVIFDVHEDCVTGLKQKSYVPRSLRFLFAHLIGFLEKALSNGCRRIIAERYYEERYPDALKVYNYPILNRVQVARVQQPALDVELDPRFRWYLYTGKITEDRGALTQLRLLEANPLAALCYVGSCSHDLGDALDASLAARGIAPERLRVIGRGTYVPKEVVDRITMGRSWIAGLALFPITEHYQKKELTKFFEYMQAGLPVLASDTPTWHGLIHDQVGFTVDSENLELLARLSRELEENGPLRARFASRGRECVERRFNWDQEEAKLVSFYASMLEPTRGRRRGKEATTLHLASERSTHTSVPPPMHLGTPESRGPASAPQPVRQAE